MSKIPFAFIGLIAIIWFFIRVIPKPQRATYPCMKVAYPLMSGFVVWLIGITGMASVIKILMMKIRKRKYFLSGIMVLILMILFIIHNSISTIPLFAKQNYNSPVHAPNMPFGTAQGIFPGRVVWAWNPDATNEDCTNDIAENDGYFLEKNNNQEVIDKMFSKAIMNIAGESTVEKSWDKIFRYFNQKKGKGKGGYRKGETIFIKINMGCANWSTGDDLSRREGSLGYAETSPQIICSVLNHLVNMQKIRQEDIIVADPMSHIYSDVYRILHSKYPNVRYGDRDEANVLFGRTLLHAEKDPVIFYSDKGSVMQSLSDCIYSEMHSADYIINIAALKAHGCAGITLTGKNHFGSITKKSAAHLHKGLVGERNDKPYRLDYKLYRVQVDMMGSRYLGQNTLLYIIDGLWGGPEATQVPVKWRSEPFNNDWPNSIFLSLDQVALESVCFDFLRFEAETGSPEWRNRPNMAQGVDDYLHQAASREWWPENISYDPDGKGVPIGSLGVHEHWNNPGNKLYSGNLGINGGIELFKILP